MRVSIVGFPYCGKSTLFSAISGLPREHLKLGEENLATVKVPEPRLDWLEALYKPRKRTEAAIDFVDLPASTEGEGEAGLAKHLPTLRQSDALLLVARAFESDAVPKYRNRIDPRQDLQSLREEMLLADLIICDKRVEKLEDAVKRPTREREKQQRELALLTRCRDALQSEQPLSSVDVSNPEDEKALRTYGFLTQKRAVSVINVGEESIGAPAPFEDSGSTATFTVCAEIEAEIMQVDPADRPDFMEGYGIKELARDRVIRACYEALGMISFLTVGPDEVRAWSVPRGATAVEAAGKIHSDLARGFIRAETVSYEDLRTAGEMREAKAQNKVRQEPKHYVVQDGDILNIKFNV